MQIHQPFAERLNAAVRRCGNPVLVGLDPRADLLPRGVLAEGERAALPKLSAAFRVFCRGVIDAVAGLVPAVKPQMAFFEQLGPAGADVLKDTIDYAAANGLLVVADAQTARGQSGLYQWVSEHYILTACGVAAAIAVPCALIDTEKKSSSP